MKLLNQFQIQESIQQPVAVQESTSKPAEVQEVTPTYVVDKVADLAIANKDAGLVLAGSIGLAIVLWSISYSAAILIRAIRN